MLSALCVVEGSEPVVVDMPTLRQRGKTPEQIKAQRWECKFCQREMVARTGAIRDWYFAHKIEASECPVYQESEPESPRHLALKKAAGEALRNHFGKEVSKLEYEVRFPELHRIADALLTLRDGTQIAIEAQLSSIPLSQIQERTTAYLQGEVEVIWVFLEQTRGGLREGGTWEAARDWLLSEGHFVLTAKTVIQEKVMRLPAQM